MKLRTDIQMRIVLWGCFLLPLAVLVFIFRGTIFVSAIPSHIDALLNYVPYYFSMSAGGSIVKSEIISGFPILLSVSTTWFNPLNVVLLYFFNAFDAFRILDVFYILAAYVATYFFARHLKLSHAAAALSGIVYLCAGQVMLWSETIIIAGYYVILPIVAWGLSMASEYMGWRRLIFFTGVGLMLGLGWRMGHVQFLIYIHGFFVAYWLFLGWRMRASRDTLHWIRWSLLLVVALTLSFAMGAAQILPILNFVGETGRSTGVPLSMAFANTYYPYHIIHYILPSFSLPEPFPYHTALPNYLGIVPLALLALGVANARTIIRHNAKSLFFLGAGLFCLLASIRYSPVVYAFHVLPFLKTFRESSRIMFVGDFSIALFIGFTVDYVAAHSQKLSMQLDRLRRIVDRFLLWVVVPVVVLFTLIQVFLFSYIETFAQRYFVAHQWSRVQGGYPLEHYFAIIHERLAQTIGQLSLTDWNVVVLLGSLASLAWLLRRRIDAHNFVVLVLCLTSLNFMFQYAQRVHGIDKYTYLSLPSTAEVIISREVNSREPYRIFGPFNDTALFDESTRCGYPKYGGWDISSQEFNFRRELIEPNLPMLYGLESADGYEPYMPSRTADVIGYVGSRYGDADRFGLNLASMAGTIRAKTPYFLERLNVLRMMNVKYVVSHYELLSDELIQRHVVRVGDCRSSVYVYELTKPWPRYFLTDEIIGTDAPDEGGRFVAVMEKITSSSAPIAVFDGAAFTSDGTGTTQIVQPQGFADALRFEVEVARPSALIIGNQWLPGWHATVDGAPALIRRVNWMYMSVDVPAGKHTIILQYE